jgi:chromosome segregation ATPase
VSLEAALPLVGVPILIVPFLKIMSKRSRTDVKYAIDLLWTHQVRRENTFLHEEIQRLQEQVTSAPTDLKAVQQTASAAQKSAETTSSVLDHFRQNLQELQQGHDEAAKRIEDITEQVGLLESRIDIVKKHQEQSTASLTSANQHLTSQIQISVEQHNRRLSSLDTTIAGLKHGLEGVVKSSELRALEDRVGQLKEQIQSLVGCQPSPGRVIDSLEERIHRGVAGQ